MMRAEKRGASYSPPRVVSRWDLVITSLLKLIEDFIPCLRIISSSYITLGNECTAVLSLILHIIFCCET